MLSERAIDLLESVRRKRSGVFQQSCPGRRNECAPADIISLNGEGLVFEKPQGLGLACSENDSDFIPEGAVSSATLSPIAEDDYLADCVQRLMLQYLEIDSPPETALAACTDALRSFRGKLLAHDKDLGVDLRHWEAGCSPVYADQCH